MSKIHGIMYKSKEVHVHEEVQKGLEIKSTNRGYAWPFISPQYNKPPFGNLKCHKILKHFHLPSHLNIQIAQFFILCQDLQTLKNIMCNIIVPILGSNIYNLLIFDENKSCLMSISKNWDLFINHI